ncbi:MAG: DNA recombination protein RmuC, partial [Ignavibacteriales bacterium]|nr:DNA recombination protein RmuC [Ignavibacteriales bacterium]
PKFFLGSISRADSSFSRSHKKRMDVLTLILLGAVVVLLVILLSRKSVPVQTDYSQTMQLMQQQVEALRGDMRVSLQHVSENLNQQLNSVTQQLQTQTTSVGNRLDNAARVIGDVQKNLGQLGQATQEIKELGQSVSKLEELLRAPKLRGGLGELLLEDLLKQVLPSEHFEMQYKFKNGQTVDAIIKTSEGIVPVDSKFPLENFKKFYQASTESEKKQFQKTFLSDVKKHIEAIAGKYILPDEGTFPFALMYIPAENIYYEVIIKDEGAEVYQLALSKNVVPVSPNSFYAYLQVIALGLRGLKIEQSAKQILNTLGRLQGDIGKVRDAFETLGTHLNNARNKYDEADKRLSLFENKLEGIAERTITNEQSEPNYQLLR